MSKKKEREIKLMWAIVILLVIIGVIIVFRRMFFLVDVFDGGYEAPKATTGKPVFPEEEFAVNSLLTFIHILPGLLFVVLGPLQFVKRIRAKWPVVHRWIGKIVMISGLVIGVSGIIMGFKMPIGGVSLTAASTLFGMLFLFSLVKAYLLIRRGNLELHRQWMIRAFAIGIAVTTTRPIMGVFFATSPLTGLTVEDFFGTALWIGFTVHLIAAETWINYTRSISERV